MPRHIIIGFSGYAKTGKDACADYLVKKYNAIHTGLADPAKRHMMEVYGFTEDQVFGAAKDEVDPRIGVKPRILLQDYMKLLQDRYEPTWIEKGIKVHKELANSKLRYERTKGVIESSYDGRFLNHAQFLDPKFEYVVITTFSDIRHWHDVRGVKNNGGAVVRVKRPGIDKPPFDHRSETEQATIPDEEFHFIIDNDFGLEDLYRKIDSVIEYLMKFGFPEVPIFL
jgi:hypothetical protein